MMEKNGNLDAALDWRAEINSQARRKIVDSICAKLKEQWPAYGHDAMILEGITNLAMKFEDEMFNKANSKEQYIYNISRKMSRIENRPEGSSSIQDHPAFSSNKSVVQMKKEDVFVSQPLPQMTNQPYPQPTIRHQPAAPNPLLRQNVMQLTPQSHEQLHKQNLNARETHQQFGLHNQSCVRPQNTLNSPCRPLGLQSRDSGVYMSPQRFPPHSEVLNLQPNKNLRFQRKEEVIGEDFRASPVLHPHYTPRGPDTVTDQQHKQHRSMGVSVAVSIENSKAEDWHDQAYNKMQGLKMTCLPLLKESYERASKLCPGAGQTEQIQKRKNHMGLMQKMMNFLELPRDKITYFTKEKFYLSMKSIEKFMIIHENKNVLFVNKQQPLHGQPSLTQAHINPVPRSDNANPHSQTLNLAATGSSDSSSSRAPSEIGSSRPEANKIQKNLRQQPEIINQEFQSSQIQQKLKPTENIQAINRSEVSWEYHLNSKHSPQTHEEASQLPKIAERAPPKDPCSSVYGRDGRASPTPSSSTVGLGKCSSNVSCLSSLNFQCPQTRNSVSSLNSKTEIRLQSHEIRSFGTLTSEFAEPTSLGSNQHLSTASQPLDRLLKAVESMSNQALRTAVLGISSVGNMCDMITEPSAFGTMHHQKAAHLSLQDGCGSSNNMKRKICATTLNDTPSPCSDNDGSSELTVSSRSKKFKKLTDNALLEEMRNINQRLVETVLELDSAENVIRRFTNAGTVVRCKYSAVSDRNNLMFHFTNTLKLPVLCVKLLVPLDYPEDYPVFLSKFNTDSSTEDEECRDLLRKATSMLQAFLRTAPERLSLEDYARAWDQCARSVVSEYAQRTGGGCFSSRYGTWEDCVAAT